MWLWYDARRAGWQANVGRVARLRRMVSANISRWLAGSSVAPGIDAIMNVDHLPARVRQIYVSDFEAFMKYHPAATCGAVTLFRSKGQPLFGSHEPDLGWTRISREPVTIHHVPGNHTSLLTEPNVSCLAATLREALESAQALEKTQVRKSG